MSITLSIVLGLVATFFLLPTLSDALSLVRWLVLRPQRTPRPEMLPSPLPRLLVLVPAHDEALLIRRTMASLRDVEYPADRLSVLVVADNCSDDTAAIVRAEGARCLERCDLERRGKPWALHWALSQLPIADYDAVIVLDADSVVNRGFFREVAAAGPLRQRAFQSYTGVANPNDSALTRMATVFSAVRFHLINGLKERAGLNVPLVNGLAIGTDVLAVHGWRAFSICEDWEMYAALTAAGVEIRNLPRAHNYAQEAHSLMHAGTQRERWAAGKVTVLTQLAPSLLRSRRIGVAQKLDALAELTSVGPVVLAGISAASIAVLAIVRPPAWDALVVAFTLPIVRIALLTLAAVPLVRQPLRAAGAFLFLPVYGPWRLIVQLRSMRLLRDAPWVRTERHTSAPHGTAKI